MNIEAAEKLRDQLCSCLEQIKGRRVAEGVSTTVSLNEDSAEMFFGLLCEWIVTTKELVAGPLTAKDVNETNAARLQTRMKYAFVRIPKAKTVVCIPRDEYDGLCDVYKARILTCKTSAGRELAKSNFYDSCDEYPPAVYLDFE